MLSPLEFLSRPQEISFLIDELERWAATSPEWAARLNLHQIGVLGDSLGGSTALALAGAEISFAHLEETCNQDLLLFNLSLYLQCQARFLPPQNRNLRDPRIKAAITAHPVGGALYGPEGIGQIEIPLLMAVGSRDIVASTITEQIHSVYLDAISSEIFSPDHRRHSLHHKTRTWGRSRALVTADWRTSRHWLSLL